jgi:hypothetical protein
MQERRSFRLTGSRPNTSEDKFRFGVAEEAEQNLRAHTPDTGLAHGSKDPMKYLHTRGEMEFVNMTPHVSVTQRANLAPLQHSPWQKNEPKYWVS